MCKLEIMRKQKNSLILFLIVLSTLFSLQAQNKKEYTDKEIEFDKQPIIESLQKAGYEEEDINNIVSIERNKAVKEFNSLLEKGKLNALKRTAISDCNVPQEQVEALKDLHIALDGKNWKTYNWDYNTPVCEWPGVGTDGYDITSINLIGTFDLKGYIPNNVFSRLPQLSYIKLYPLEYDIDKPFPSDINSLKELKTLNIHYNYNVKGYSKKFPEISNLLKLENLHISMPPDYPDVMPDISMLVNLRQLSLSNIKLSNTTTILPEIFKNFTQLEHLDLCKNSLIGNLPVWFSSAYKNLQFLSLKDQDFQGQDLKTILLGFNELKFLTLVSCGFLGDLGSTSHSLASLSKLESVIIKRNYFKGTFPKYLYDCANLRRLSIENCDFQGGIPYLPNGKLLNLRSLELLYDKLTGKVPKQFSKLPKLFRLSLWQNELEGDLPIFSNLIKNKGRNLSIMHNKFIFKNFEDDYTKYIENLTDFRYESQSAVDEEETIKVCEGEKFEIPTKLSSSNNIYTLYKDGKKILTTKVGQKPIIESFSPNDEGVYYFIATNSVVKDLRLRRRKITLKLDADCDTGGDKVDCVGIKSDLITLLNKALEKGFKNNTDLDNVQSSNIPELYSFYNPNSGSTIDTYFTLSNETSLQFDLNFSDGKSHQIQLNSLSTSLTNASSFVKTFKSIRFIDEKSGTTARYDISIKYENKQGEIVTITGQLYNVRYKLFGCEDGSDTGGDKVDCVGIKSSLVTLLNRALDRNFSTITLNNVDIDDIKTLYDFYYPSKGSITPKFENNGKSFTFELNFSETLEDRYGILQFSMNTDYSNASDFINMFKGIRFIKQNVTQDGYGIYDIELEYTDFDGKTIKDKGTLFNVRDPKLLNCEDGSDTGGGSNDDCNTCHSFKPEAGTYVLSAWVREDSYTRWTNNSNESLKSYSPNSYIKISFLDAGGQVLGKSLKFSVSQDDQVIDSWQRIYGEFEIPKYISEIKIGLYNDNANLKTRFDDIRIHPFNGSMKSFVYDPVTQQLMAELDENNYGTFYEYDKEGGLVRVKKETERGVYTIQETRSNSYKRAITEKNRR